MKGPSNLGREMNRFIIASALLLTSYQAYAEPPSGQGQYKTVQLSDDEKLKEMSQTDLLRYFSFSDAALGLPWLNERLNSPGNHRERTGTQPKLVKLTSCTLLVRTWVTKYEQGYGAKCLANLHNKKNVPVKVCADTGIGNLAIEPAERELSEGDLAQFTWDRCTGG